MKIGLHMCVLWSVGLIIGMVVTVDDDLPGGWSNPDGENSFPIGMYATAILAALLAWTLAGFCWAFTLTNIV